MRNPWGKLGLAAVILLAPGGFILGATLAANHYRKRATAGRDDLPESPSPESPVA
jgi:hypothetical protein